MRLSCLAALALTLLTIAAHANSIEFNSVSNGVYSYNLNASTSNEQFYFGSTIVISGLSGVTGASLASYASYAGFTAVFTSSSVTFTETGANGSSNFSGGDFLNIFTITSTTGVLGQASYATAGATPPLSGVISGPVAAASVTPEPSSLALLGTGLIGLVGAARKRFTS